MHMRGENIGELEELVLLTVGALDREAYAVLIMEEIKINSNRKMDVTAIHSVLRRLEKKGFVASEMGGATSERGGRRKRLYKATQEGFRVAQELKEKRNNLWKAIPGFNFQSI